MPEPLKVTNATLDQRVKALELWRTAVAIDAYKVAQKVVTDKLTADLAALILRVAKLETGGGGSVDLTTLTNRVTTLEAKVCPNQGVIDGLVNNVAVLKTDHDAPPA